MKDRALSTINCSHISGSELRKLGGNIKVLVLVLKLGPQHPRSFEIELLSADSLNDPALLTTSSPHI